MVDSRGCGDSIRCNSGGCGDSVGVPIDRVVPRKGVRISTFGRGGDDSLGVGGGGFDDTVVFGSRVGGDTVGIVDGAGSASSVGSVGGVGGAPSGVVHGVSACGGGSSPRVQGVSVWRGVGLGASVFLVAVGLLVAAGFGSGFIGSTSSVVGKDFAAENQFGLNVADEGNEGGLARDLNGNVVRGVDLSLTSRHNQVSNTGETFSIPSAGASFALGLIDVVDQSLIPTGYTSVYRVRNFGVDSVHAGEGTMYVVAHAMDTVRGTGRLTGVAPGNFLFDHNTRESRLVVGDEVVVSGLTYVFTGSMRVHKNSIDQQQGLWDAGVAGRLVFITCLSDTDDNFVSIFQLKQ